MAPRTDLPQATTPQGFRDDLYGCLDSWADTLLELCDALLCAAGPVSSVPHLSLEAVFRRSHPSLHKALARGGIDAEALRQALVEYRPKGWPAVFAVDASTWERCDAEASPERGLDCHPSRQAAGQPIVAGWSYQPITQLSWAADSPTAPVDARRIPPSADTTDATIDQVRDLVRRPGADGPAPLFIFDAGYDAIALSAQLAAGRAAILVRIRCDRVFYADPDPAPPGTAGRPRRHGDRFACADPTTWPAPDAELVTDDPVYGSVHVQAWHGLHPKLARRGRWADHDAPPIVRGVVIRAEVERLPKPAGRAVKTGWLWWSGPGSPGLDVCWRAYLRRFDIERTYRFAKHTLGWTTPAVGAPEQADRWTWLTVAAYTRTAPRARPGRRSPPALGTASRAGQAHPGPCPQGVSSTWRHLGHSGQSTKIRHCRSGTPERHPPTAPYPLPRHQEGRVKV